MSDTIVPWDRITARVRQSMPEWARYEGYGTYALAAYVYAALMAVVSSVAYSLGYLRASWLCTAIAVLALLYGSYYKGAAKIRVTCDHCGGPARGENICPHCGERTYTGDSA